MYQQRIDQSNSCIEMLNNKAIKKKKAIKLLMNLWQGSNTISRLIDVDRLIDI